MNRYGNRWTREELMAVLYLSVRYAKHLTAPQNHPVVHELAEAMGRTVASLAMRISNYKALDPTYSGPGLSNPGAPAKLLWDEYEHEPERVMSEASIAYHEFVSSHDRNRTQDTPERQTEREDKKMSLPDAIINVLKDAGKPLHYHDITKRIRKRGLWETTDSKPWAQVNAVMSAEIKHKRASSRFARAGRGVYRLNLDATDTQLGTKPHGPALNSANESTPGHQEKLFLEQRVDRIEDICNRLATKAELNELRDQVMELRKTLAWLEE